LEGSLNCLDGLWSKD
jgi:Zn-dependent protease